MIISESPVFPEINSKFRNEKAALRLHGLGQGMPLALNVLKQQGLKS